MDIKRIVLFAGLAVVSYLMVLAWNKDYHQPPQRTAADSAQIDTGTAPGQGTEDLTLPGPDTANKSEELSTPDTQTSNAGARSQAAVSADNRYVDVRTDVYDITIDRVSGNLVRASLLKYSKSLNSPDPMALLKHTANETYVLESGLIGQDGPDSRSNGDAPVYSTDANEYQLQDGQDELTVNLTLTTEQGVNITKQYQFARDSYEIGVKYLIDNQSANPWKANFTGKIVRDETPDPTAQTSMGIKSFLGLVVSTPEDPYEKHDLGDLKDNKVNQTVTGGWMAFLQHYFLSAWIPAKDVPAQFQTTHRGNLNVMGFVYPSTDVAPGDSAEVGGRVYVGPKIIDRLENVAPNLDRTVDFGWLFFISLPLFYILQWFHGLVGNWGVSIILLTVCVKAVFFHLSATSYRSMAKMRAVAPQLSRLKELYGDDRQRMSQEMMALYKREKINPLGGCLPILVQMPVFIALYWVLFESVQLRHAPFFLWIHDLSQMDPYFILPILMGASMFLQTQLNPTPPDPMQAKIMKLMPMVFTVFFLWFPAGLVLYWLVNNLLSITQQWYITRKIQNEMAAKKS